MGRGPQINGPEIHDEEISQRDRHCFVQQREKTFDPSEVIIVIIDLFFDAPKNPQWWMVLWCGTMLSVVWP